jgi:hypothetical protein
VQGQDGARRSLRFLLWLFLVPFAFLVVCLLIPPDLIPYEAGIAGSLLAAGATLWGVSVLLRAHRLSLPFPFWAIYVIALLKLCLGLWYWHTYLYDINTSRPRVDFVQHEMYHERRADVECIQQIMQIFDRAGVHYIAASEATLSINNRPPAHVAAIVVRAFGAQIPAYFPFVTLVAALGAIALVVAMGVLGISGASLRLAGWVVLLWPYGWQVANPGKDTLLYAFVSICAAVLIVSERAQARFPWGPLLAFCVLPFFRPIYALVCAGVGTSLLLRRRLPALVKVFGLALVLALGLGLTLGLSLESNVAQHAEWAPNETRLLSIPLLGKFVFGFATPFPWSQVLDGWWKYPMVYLFAQQVVSLAVIACIAHSALASATRRMPDVGTLLAFGMIACGLLVPNTQALYVHVGVHAMLPFAWLHARKPLAYYVKRSLLFFVAGNALWVLIR